ncbi:MAG: hypothetical protein ABUT20_11890 [Bacteroidota bacterium]
MMKKLLLLTTILLLIATIDYGQYDSSRLKESNANLKERLMIKSKKLKTTGWILLGTGIAVDALSLAFLPSDSDSFSSGFDKTFISAGLMLAGTAVVITSIPFFIVSGKYKRKANLIVNTSRVQLAPNVKLPGRQLAAGISINL